jgi:anti-sigma factor RsiW
MTTSDLSCREFVEVVTDYHELALSPSDRIRVEQHLVLCSACKRYEQQLRAIVRVAATVEPDDLGPESRRALLASLEHWLARRE